MNEQILLTYGYCSTELPTTRKQKKGSSPVAQGPQALGTLLSNLAYFGYAPSLALLDQLRAFDVDALDAWWQLRQPLLRALTGDDREMDKFVVYKNFPKEVLELSEAQYWFNQIFMYLGAPNEWFTQEPQERPALDERLKLKVLHLADAQTASSIYASLRAMPSRWTDVQLGHVRLLQPLMTARRFEVADFGFKENAIRAMAEVFSYSTVQLVVPDATDVLRLAAAVSGCDCSLRGEVKFRAFNRSERRRLVNLLEDSKNLVEDLAMRKELFKRLLCRLHPGDFDAPKVQAGYDMLYRGSADSFGSQVEAMLHARNPEVLQRLKTRPGDFARRLHKLVTVFGQKAADAFADVAHRLGTSELLKLRGYLVTINARQSLMYPPKGNWSKVKLVPNEKKALPQEALDRVIGAIDLALGSRLREALPQGVDLAAEMVDIKLATNDQELASYGRGTVFHLPAEAKYIRTASFWAIKRTGNIWFDNGFNFFGDSWENLGACCWSDSHGFGSGAVFSGDPTNSKDMAGRACQMIDLNIDELLQHGVRYAVWNVLAYSGIKFSDADDVLATLQWGENPCNGKLYEPARAQMVFPLKGESLTKYVAYLDLKERKLVYMDANLRGSTQSSGANGATLASVMPSFVEYLNGLPSVADLLVHAPQGKQAEGAVPVLYSDEAVELSDDRQAYVFKPLNAGNRFKQLDLSALL